MTTNAQITKDGTLWKMRLAMTQALLFDGLKKLATQSEDIKMIAVVNRPWFSGLDYSINRMLPDGEQVPGAPTPADLKLRHAIVAEVMDGMKSRPRTGYEKPCSLYQLSLEQYELIMAICQVYMQINAFLNQEDIDPYEASACETTVYTLLHVAGADEIGSLYKPIDEADLDACII